MRPAGDMWEGIGTENRWRGRGKGGKTKGEREREWRVKCDLDVKRLGGGTLFSVYSSCSVSLVAPDNIVC